MFRFWKIPYELTRGSQPEADFGNISAKEFASFANSLHCSNVSVTGEDLLKYMIEYKRADIFKSVSLEDIICMAYDKFIRKAGNLAGNEYLYWDRMHCPPEQLEQLRKIAVFKDKLRIANYDQCIALCESAIFEICRRNDAELLRIYLDEFNGYYPVEIYDAVFDYYIYMYLPEWDLLKQFNEQNDCSCGDFPGSQNNKTDSVPPELQRKLLDILILQAEKCKVPHPDVLEILMEHGISSCRVVFPIIEQSIHFGMEFSNRDSEKIQYAGRILLHYDDKELAPENCIDPFELDKLLAQTNFGIPVTCTCGDEGCGGIRACSESWAIGKKLRLYIPEGARMYFFEIADRFALRQELSLILKHVIRTLQCHKKWQKAGIVPPDDDDDETPFLPHGTSLSDLRKLSKDIAEDLSKA